MMSTLKKVSIHRPKLRVLTLEQFSYFLAGLIDADGYINKLGYFVIPFHRRDLSVAYLIKKRIGYGKVTQIQDQKKPAIFVCSHPIGRQLMGQLVWGKLINPDRIEQFNSRFIPFLSVRLHQELLSHVPFLQKGIKGKDKEILPIDKPGTLSLQNHWLAGFIQGDGSFQIEFVKDENQWKEEVQIILRIDSKNLEILNQLQALVGGFIGYSAPQNTYYYSSVSFGRTVEYIHYLDRFQVMGSCSTLYAMWRKSYLIVQEQNHLNQKGIDRIAKIQARMSKLRLN